jgi:thymidylate synthase ThyX
MTISAKIIADSVSPRGVRLTTLQLVYPRFIHAEFMTHRVFSRNASSSRAIPVAKMIEQVRTNPAAPLHWGANQPGMQAHQQLDEPQLSLTKTNWLQAARAAADIAEEMNRHGAHKQVANRILEPFQHIHVVVTATEFANFFELRNHPDAQPEIRALARVMLAAMNGSTPEALLPCQWHLPYVTAADTSAFGPVQTYLRGGPDGMQVWTDAMIDALCRKLSAARCARVSYLTHDNEQPDVAKDLALYERLVGSVPLHASPVEHQATPDEWHEDTDGFTGYEQSSAHGNFKGWVQNRKLLELEFAQP